MNESLHPPGSLLYMDFLFYDIESVRGYTSVLDITYLSTRCPFSFLCRSKRHPLDVLQCLFNMLNARKRSVRRIRVDEDGALANSYEFNKLLINNNMQLETTGGYGSKLNKIIERPNREYHVKNRIALGIQ